MTYRERYPHLTEAQWRALAVCSGFGGDPPSLSACSNEWPLLAIFGLVAKNNYAWFGYIITGAGRVALATRGGKS